MGEGERAAAMEALAKRSPGQLAPILSTIATRLSAEAERAGVGWWQNMENEAKNSMYGGVSTSHGLHVAAQAREAAVLVLARASGISLASPVAHAVSAARKRQ